MLKQERGAGRCFTRAECEEALRASVHTSGSSEWAYPYNPQDWLGAQQLLQALTLLLRQESALGPPVVSTGLSPPVSLRLEGRGAAAADGGIRDGGGGGGGIGDGGGDGGGGGGDGSGDGGGDGGGGGSDGGGGGGGGSGGGTDSGDSGRSDSGKEGRVVTSGAAVAGGEPGGEPGQPGQPGGQGRCASWCAAMGEAAGKLRRGLRTWLMGVRDPALFGGRGTVMHAVEDFARNGDVDKLGAEAAAAVPASKRSEPPLLQLLLQAILSRTLELVWMALILNHAVSGALLSLPYPFACFCYGALESPQPNRRFFSLLLWYTPRNYTLVWRGMACSPLLGMGVVLMRPLMATTRHSMLPRHETHHGYLYPGTPCSSWASRWPTSCPSSAARRRYRSAPRSTTAATTTTNY